MHADDMHADEIPTDARTLTALAELTVRTPPTALRSATIAAALQRRPAGTRPVAPMSPVDAYRRTIEVLDDLLGTLEPADWDAPAPTGTVRSLIGHLGGVEQYMLAMAGEVEHPDPASDSDHVGVTAQSIADATTDANDAVRSRWRARANAVVAVGEARSLDTTLPLHGLGITTGGAFLLRTFEVWTHTEDICRSLGRRLMPPDIDRIQLMSSSLCEVLVGGMHLAGVPRTSGTVTLRLTGSGGGVYRHTLGPGPDPSTEPEVSIVTDVVDICRLAARRISPADLNAVITGDDELARDVFAGLAAFAMD